MFQLFHSNPSPFMTVYICTAGNVIVWWFLAQERAVICSMWGYQQVVMCTDEVVMQYVS